jgi:protein-tyrosine kinase
MGTISKVLKKYKKSKKAAAPDSASKAGSEATTKIRATEKNVKRKGPVTQGAQLPPLSRKLRTLSTQQPRPKNEKIPKIDRSIDVRETGQTKGGEETRPPAPDLSLIDRDLVSLRNPDSMETKLFKHLRNKILFPQEGRAPRSIMVTSALSGEGKSFVAANLAVNLAQNIDEHVLLMDCDLRVPCLHLKFGFGEVKGLSEYLANGTTLSPLLLLKTSVNKLTLLPAGSPPANPAEILSSDKMADLIDELLARYDDRYIIIDAPPPLVVPDINAIAKKVDGIILVTNYRKTNLDLLDELIGEVGIEKIIGAVINRSRARSSRRYGYKRLQKYSKYNRP